MKTKLLKALTVFLTLMLVICVPLNALTVNAEGYSSYQERQDQYKNYMVKQKAVYTADEKITGSDLGIGDFAAPKDLCVQGEKIYILDSGNSRIVVLNSDYSFSQTIENISLNGEVVNLAEAEGLFVSKDGTMYIADPVNMRVLVVNSQGEVTYSITKPESPIVPQSLEFKAKKVLVDIDGYIFVLCDGVYYGAMVFDTSYNFCGFFGANQTASNLLDTIKYFFTKVLQTDTQKQYSLRTLPYEFDDLYEYNGFIYTATEISENGKGQIRKLSNSGINTLNHNGTSGDDYAFGNGKEVTLIDKTVATESFCSLAVDEKGYIYTLDATYGRVFVYDSDCNLVTAFGGGLGLGQQIGSFESACEIVLNGTDVLVVDDATNIITVFEKTDFGTLLYSAINAEADGAFQDAFALWKQVLAKDAFNQRAYTGMANFYLSEGDYENALSYAEKALNKDIYEQAFEQIRRDFLAENLIYVFIIAFILLGVISFLVIRRKKKGVTEKDNKEWGFVKRTLLSIRHPIDTAIYIKSLRVNKEKKKLNIYTAIAFLIFFLMFVFKVLETTSGGFLYVSFDSDSYNSMLVFISTFGIAFLWCVINWALCTLFEGKGTFKEIVVATGFAMIPQIINSIFFIIASHCFVYSESSIITGFAAIAWIATAVILLVELSVIHDYSFFRSIGMSIATILGMCIAAFLILLVLTLVQDMTGFVRSIYNEVIYRGS